MQGVSPTVSQKHSQYADGHQNACVTDTLHWSYQPELSRKLKDYNNHLHLSYDEIITSYQMQLYVFSSRNSLSLLRWRYEIWWQVKPPSLCFLFENILKRISKRILLRTNSTFGHGPLVLWLQCFRSESFAAIRLMVYEFGYTYIWV